MYTFTFVVLNNDGNNDTARKVSDDNNNKLYFKRMDDELGFYVPSTVFQSFRDDGRVNMKGSVQ